MFYQLIFLLLFNKNKILLFIYEMKHKNVNNQKEN